MCFKMSTLQPIHQKMFFQYVCLKAISTFVRPLFAPIHEVFALVQTLIINPSSTFSGRSDLLMLTKRFGGLEGGAMVALEIKLTS